MATFPAAIVNYDWRVEYAYVGIKVRTQTGALSALSFTEACGVLPGNGTVVPITVRLTATDSAGNTATLFRAGEMTGAAAANLQLSVELGPETAAQATAFPPLSTRRLNRCGHAVRTGRSETHK